MVKPPLADLTTERSYALQTVVEQLQATSFAAVGTGNAAVGSFNLEWVALAESGTSKIVTVVTAGPGLASTAGGGFPALSPTVVDTFTFRVISK